MPTGKSYPKCFDPYLLYAISAGFINFELFDEKSGFMLFFLVEFRKPGQAARFAADMNAALRTFPSMNKPVELGPADDNVPYATMRAPALAVTAALQPSPLFDIWQQYVSRVELSLPLRPEQSRLRKSQIRPTERWNEGKTPSGELLIGILDDGCPFAASQFLRASSTRVRAIWDQNQGRQPIEIKDSAGNSYQFGQRLPDFKYGLEFWRDLKTPGRRQKRIGFDDWMQLHVTPTDSIDEDGCYADAKFTRLAPRLSHGAHVLDVLAGRIPTKSRVSPLKIQNGYGSLQPDPPSWRPGHDPASGADVVFVQFPDNCIRDATGVWLKAYVLDGIRYILTFANPKKTEHVIINLSYGPTTGPHDGTAVLEKALTALVKEFDGRTKKPKLEVFLAAGNSYLTEGHVAFARGKGQPDNIEWTWRLLPDNTVLCFAEVWMNKTHAEHVTVTLTSPGGTTTPANGPIVWGHNYMWLLEVGPTVMGGRSAPSDHGDYRIKVAGIRQDAHVHAYVARTDPNMGVLTGARDSYFVDPNWEQTQSASAGCSYVNGEFDKTGSLISRYGTLNGIATANAPGVHVAGGDILANGLRKATYSSAGPARKDSRVGPDYALFCDENYALRGVRGGGTRSGAVFRLIGTSAATPQLARRIAKGGSPQVYDRTTTHLEKEKRGGGDVAPPDAEDGYR